MAGQSRGYGIQGLAAQHVAWLEGSYTGIVGLPLFEVSQVLRGMGWVFTAPIAAMTKPPNTDEPPIIIIDDLPSYRRVALVRDGVLDQLWIDNAADHTPQPGAVFAARVPQIFAGHDRATFELKIDGHAEGRAVNRLWPAAGSPQTKPRR